VVGRVFDLKRHSNIKRGAEYRRIDKYVKSLEQTKRERVRRLRVLELWFLGWGVGKIALEVGVSKRTVHRDLERLGETIRRRFGRGVRVGVEEQRLALVRGLEGLSPVVQAKRLNVLSHLRRGVRRECHKLLVKIDADALGVGGNALSFKPGFAFLVAPYVINFQLVVGGDCFGVGQLRVE
jgi:AraC-like DNA-binding protein